MPMLFRWGVFFLPGLMLLSAQAQNNRDGFYIGIDASFESLSVKSTSATENFGSGTSAVLHGGYELSIQDNLITVEWATLPTHQKSFTSFKSGTAIAPNLSMFTVGL